MLWTFWKGGRACQPVNYVEILENETNSTKYVFLFGKTLVTDDESICNKIIIVEKTWYLKFARFALNYF